jgi:hypothetical protein
VVPLAMFVPWTGIPTPTPIPTFSMKVMIEWNITQDRGVERDRCGCHPDGVSPLVDT